MLVNVVSSRIDAVLRSKRLVYTKVDRQITKEESAESLSIFAGRFLHFYVLTQPNSCDIAISYFSIWIDDVNGPTNNPNNYIVALLCEFRILLKEARKDYFHEVDVETETCRDSSSPLVFFTPLKLSATLNTTSGWHKIGT